MNWHKEKIKILLKHTKEDYERLKSYGVFFEYFPDYSGDYEEDMKKARKELKK